MAYNKIVYGNSILIDLTGDTAAQADVLAGKTFHEADGDQVTGTCTFDADTSDATAVAGEILSGKTAYVDGAKITGAMANKGAVSGTIATKAGTYAIPAGYHNGSGSVAISGTEQAKILAANIKSGVTILGVAGTYTGAGVTSQAKSVTPTSAQQVISPDTGYDYLSQVTVAAIPYAETSNSAGGTTVTIG